MQLEGDLNNFVLRNLFSNFVTYVILTGIYEVIDSNNTLDNSIKANVSTDIITMKLGLETNTTLRFDEVSFCYNIGRYSTLEL